ncbi:hypothetical protein ASH04_05635 [Rhodococcus sp. Leaf233]|nr:hypothetical protein ASH04_05635 [Rhodococcus sp. Leaf233]
MLEEFDRLFVGDAVSASGMPDTVFIDAIDEALQVDPNVGYILTTQLKRPESNRFKWRFACRPGSWTPDLASGMASLPGFEQLELLPLGVADIRELAGSDAAEFLTAVEGARLTHLLAQPLHATNLLDQWRTSNRLPVDRGAAMQYAVTEMLAETSTTRTPGKLDDHRRLLIAERLAAISMLCGVSAYTLGPTARSVAEATPALALHRSTAVTSVPTQSEPDLHHLDVDSIREVLHSPLFTTRESSSVSFIHQSYSEYLAARYLARRGVTGTRLVSILGANTNGRVPESLLEVLGWMLTLGNPVPSSLVADNAKQLLSTSGLELAPDSVKEAVVRALIDGAASGQIDEGWRTDTSPLAHPGLASQLANAATCATNEWVVYWIARIARQCTVIDSADNVLSIALDSRWPDYIRAEAVTSFGEIASADRTIDLNPLLTLGSDQDPQDEILAATMSVMAQEVNNYDLVREAIRPRRSPNFIGNYFRILSGLPKLLPIGTLIPTLTHVLHQQTGHDDRVFGYLIGNLLERVWTTMNREAAELVGILLSPELLSVGDVFQALDVPWQVHPDTSKRRAMAAASLSASENSYYTVLELQMLTGEDVEWLIDWVQDAPPEAIRPALVVLRHLAWNIDGSSAAERVLDIGDDHLAYEVLSAFQGHQAVSTRPYDIKIKPGPDTPPRPELASLLDNAMAAAHVDSTCWWRVPVALLGDLHTVDTDLMSGWDLTLKPMWSTLTEGAKDATLKDGLDYISSIRPVLTNWHGAERFNLDDAMPDWAGVFLVGTLAAHYPDTFLVIEPATLAIWTEAIILMPDQTADTTWKRRIRTISTEAGRVAIDRVLRERIERTDTAYFADNPLADYSVACLLTSIEHIARSSEQPVQRRDEALKVLGEQAPGVGLEIAKAMITEDQVPPTAFRMLARSAPDELVAAWTQHGHIDRIDELDSIRSEALSDFSLTHLTEKLLKGIKSEDNPKPTLGFAERTHGSTAHSTIRALLQTMASRGLVAALRSLQSGSSDQYVEHIRHLLQEATTREAIINWKPITPSTLMELFAKGDARLIRDSSDLLIVLLEQLEQIQHDIRDLSAYRSLWDGEPGTKDAKLKNEDTISDWLKDQLRLRLLSSVVIDREIQVTRPKPRGVGTRMDITATSSGAEVGRVVFEAKLVTNRELLTAIGDQLVDQYLTPTGLTHAIYIVYWTAAEYRREKMQPDADILAEILRAQARSQQPTQIEVVVLDVGPLPAV